MRCHSNKTYLNKCAHFHGSDKERKNNMKVLIVEPDKYAREAEIDPSLKSMQSIVGGSIEAVYPWQEKVCAVCNDEGKLDGLPLNRALEDYDAIAGTFFICGLGAEDFTDLTPAQMKKYKEKFYQPEMFLRTPEGVFAIKVDPKYEKLSAEKAKEKSKAEPTKSKKPRQQER